MIWPNNKILSAAVIVALGAQLGCGVKGDPLPPEKPVEIGRGRPTYKRATEGLRIDKTKKPVAAPEEEEEDEE